jgi:hypothetical protein
LIVTSPIAPGEKQLAIQYRIPAGRKNVELPLEQPGVAVNVLTEEPDVRVIGRGIAAADSQVIEGRFFQRWAGVVPNGHIRIMLPGAGRPPGWLLAVLVAGLGLTLGGAGWYLLARREPATKILPDELIDAIAALDARYLGREGETAAQEWSSYQQERARLKAELESSLAAGGWTR